jgi:starch-binding outer membrane protein, SusD/RagB family
MHTSRSTLFGRRMWLVIAAGATLLSACNVDHFLRSNDPDNTPPGILTGPSSLPGYRANAIGDFGLAFDGNAGNPNGNEYEGLVNMSGLLTDELQNTETFPTRTEVDRRHTQINNATMRDIFFNAEAARASGARASGAFAAFGATDPARSEVVSLQAYSILLLAEDFCSGVPLSGIDTATSALVEGAPMTTQQLLTVASDTFSSAISLAADDDRRFLADVGKARTLQFVGRSQLAAAAALVSAIPTDWTYKINHSKNSQREWNGIYEFMWLEGRWVEADTEGTNGLRYRDDPRNPFSTDGSTFVGSPFFGTLRYNSQDSSTVLASGIEARLIEAEAALEAGQHTIFLNDLNALRNDGTFELKGKDTLVTNAGADTTITDHKFFHPGTGHVADLAPLDDSSSVTRGQDLLFRERGQWLYLTSHRLPDLRRLSRSTSNGGYGRDPETVFPTGLWFRGGAYGTDVNFPIPIEELSNTLVKSGPLTCLDRLP